MTLRDYFAEYGEVSSAKVIMDKFTGKSRGFAFVEMSDDEAAKKAIEELDGATVDGRTIGVSVAKPREERAGGNRGGSGGFQRRNRTIPTADIKIFYDHSLLDRADPEGSLFSAS